MNVLPSQRLSSTTTRIKTLDSQPHNYQGKVRDYLPLQQGLRLVFTKCVGYAVLDVRDYLPLQQGLRHGHPYWYEGESIGQRLSSTTTRIKTTYVTIKIVSS